MKAQKIRPTREWTEPPRCEVTAPRPPTATSKPDGLGKLRRRARERIRAKNTAPDGINPGTFHKIPPSFKPYRGCLIRRKDKTFLVCIEQDRVKITKVYPDYCLSRTKRLDDFIFVSPELSGEINHAIELAKASLADSKTLG